ncbi:MAG: UDP-N-acetylglucosamine 1-carboxyvinyltransferase [Pelagibacteraceae bacterium]
MQKLIISGKKYLSGAISISGSKNATLPILAATILCNKAKIENVPLVKDVFTMIELLSSIGLKINIKKKNKIIKVINSKKNLNTIAPYKLVKTMRAGVLVLGPLLAKYKKAKVSLPGGCAIGTRPVNLHLFALKKLGAKIKIKNGYIHATARKGLKGNKIKFPEISVGATENAIIAASQAKGKTILINCAIEPEIKDLIIFLRKLGAKILIKKRTITVLGKFEPKIVKHKIMFDRIEAGTYLIASALVGKKISILKIDPKIINTELKILKKMGIKIKILKDKITVSDSKLIKPINLTTAPFPGFPTDLQAQLMVLTTKAKGISKIKENIFENRFMHVPELKRMGAKISIKNNIATINGPTNLSGAEVMATDLRASVCLVLAGLVADNRTIINRIYHLDRGYEKLEKKLNSCKAKIKRI